MPPVRPALQILYITLFRVLLNTARRFVYPFAPALSRGLGVPLGAVTAIIAVIQFSSLVGLFSGPLADRYGYRRVMRAGLALLAAGMLLCCMLPTYWPVFLGLVVATLGKVVFDPAIQAFVGTSIPFARRARIIGIIETSWAGSTLIGIPALSMIIEQAGLRASFLIVSLLGGISWLAITRVIPPDDKVVRQAVRQTPLFEMLGGLLRIRSAIGMLLFGFLVSIANDALFVVYGAWFESEFQVGIVALGFSTMAIGCAELLGESLTALLGDRIGLQRGMIGGLVLACGAYLLLPVIGQSMLPAMIGLFLIFFCFEFTIVSSFSLSTELVPGSRATMMAGFYATAGVGRMLGVVLGGFLWPHGGIHAVCLLAVVCTGGGLLAFWWGMRQWRPDRQKE